MLPKYVCIRANGGFDEWSVVLIESWPCLNREEARKREQYWIEQYAANLNSRRAYTSVVDKADDQAKYRATNKDYFVEYRATKREYHTKYTAEYRITNKARIAKNQAEYYALNREVINEKARAKCPAKKLKKIAETADNGDNGETITKEKTM